MTRIKWIGALVVAVNLAGLAEAWTQESGTALSQAKAWGEKSGAKALFQGLVAVSAVNGAPVEFKIDPPPGTIPKVEPAAMKHILEIVKKVATRSADGLYDETWHHDLQGCMTTNGGLVLLPNSTVELNTAITNYVGGSRKGLDPDQVYQVLVFNETAFKLNVKTTMKEDGSQVLVGLSLARGIYNDHFNIALDGRVLYDSPYQLTQKSQAMLRAYIDFWSNVPVENLDGELSVGKVAFPLECRKPTDY